MIEGERVLLRKLERADLATLHRWMNDRDVMAWARFSPDHMVSLSALEKEFETELTGENREHITFVIEERSSGRPIGWCTVRTGDRKHVSANLGIGLGEKALWGKGYGTEAVSLLLGVVFDQQAWHRADLYTLAENVRAIRSAEKGGFRECGREHESTYYDGGYRDVVEMELLKSEWDARKTGRPRRVRTPKRSTP